MLQRQRCSFSITQGNSELPGWASTRKVKPIWILLKQETVSGSGISWVVCKSAPRSRQIITPAPHHSVFYRLNALPAAQPTASKHSRQKHWRQGRSSFIAWTLQSRRVACCVLVVVQSWMTDLEIFAVMTASLIHDYEHTGTTNTFHINTASAAP